MPLMPEQTLGFTCPGATGHSSASAALAGTSSRRAVPGSVQVQPTAPHLRPRWSRVAPAQVFLAPAGHGKPASAPPCGGHKSVGN